MQTASQAPAPLSETSSSFTRDPGVVGLARLRTRSNSNTAEPLPSATLARSDSSALPAQPRWGDEDAAFLEAKAKKIATLREETRQSLEQRLTWKHVALASLSVLAYQRVVRALGFQARRATAWLFLIALTRALWVNRAPKRLSPEKTKIFTTWPIFGQIGIIPFGLSITMLELQKYVNKRRNYQSAEMVMFGNTHDFSVMNPEDREYVLKTNWKNFTKNNRSTTSFDEIFAELMGRGIFAVDGDEWQDHRKIASHLFSANGLRTKMEASFKSHGALLSKILDKLIDTSTDKSVTLDWQDTMQAFTFETICEIAFGVEPGALEAALLRHEKIQFLVSFDQLQTDSLFRIIYPRFVWKAMRLLNVGFEKRMRDNGHYVRDYVAKIIRERTTSSSLESQEDLLSMYIRTSRATSKPWMESEEYLSDAILNFMVAGRDTTSFTLIHLFEILAQEPAVAEKMLAELDRVVGRDKDVSWDDVRELPYCGAVFNETLRLYPPVAGDFRIVAKDDVLPSGIKVPANSRVSFPNVAIGRDPHLWSDPESFQPERWIDPADPAKPVKRVDEYVHPVFYGGPRLCLGKDMARLEVLSVAYTMLKRFNLSVLPNQNKRVIDGPVSFYQEGVKVRITRR